MDLERIRERALEMKKVLEDIFASGLSRTAFQSADSLERLAVISHNEDLASFEDSFRSLHTGYEHTSPPGIGKCCRPHGGERPPV